jgi:uncharacterized cupin superfamily protein
MRTFALVLADHGDRNKTETLVCLAEIRSITPTSTGSMITYNDGDTLCVWDDFKGFVKILEPVEPK